MDRGPLELELCFCSLLADLEMIPIFEVIADILGNSSQQLLKNSHSNGGTTDLHLDGRKSSFSNRHDLLAKKNLQLSPIYYHILLRSSILHSSIGSSSTCFPKTSSWRSIPLVEPKSQPTNPSGCLSVGSSSTHASASPNPPAASSSFSLES